ncbi:hypothetical protein C8R44DRAFT_226865 [Mycena epipterygia]|nr:hypothetical protein C8R44DRAFT_226865 [Mycena epipterygia]
MIQFGPGQSSHCRTRMRLHTYPILGWMILVGEIPGGMTIGWLWKMAGLGVFRASLCFINLNRLGTRFYCPYGPVIERVLWPGHRGSCWLSQANHISIHYPISANHGWVWQIKYEITFSTLSDNLPEAYLFLCPLNDLQSEDGSFIERPECPAYWSLDPAGTERLSPDAVSAIGFPKLGWERKIGCRSWDNHVYSGLRQFHAAKRFDPNTQDIARHLGEGLYELSCDPRVEEVFPKDLSKSATTANEGDPGNEDGMSTKTNPDTQKTDQAHHTCSEIKEFASCLLTVQNFRLIVAGAVGMILALISAYLYSLNVVF